MSKLYLILSIHNHQPVGNFEHVFEEAYKNAYLPFLERFSAHPKLKTVLHYSGNLLLWIEKRHPEAFDLLRKLINNKRVELLSGGFYEPILSMLPEKDRVMQIKEMTAYIQDRFNYTPKGMWLAERVWEPQMPKYISQAGIDYLSVDDYHFKLTGLGNEDLLGYYITEDEGNSVKIFPGSENLRYLIPFKDINEVVAYFRKYYREGSSTLLTMADDGEKFGVWPETYKHCYENNWLEEFFSVLENNTDWIETITFREYQELFYSIGRVYLPTASYREMGEWTLPPQSALDYEYVLAKMQSLFGEDAKGFLSGGIWRSFFTKYPESNHLHKKMIRVSRKVHKAVSIRQAAVDSQKPKIGKLKTSDSQLPTPSLILHELWQGQCNDAYWHGIFGGLYLPHLRSSLYRHLISAETMAEKGLLMDSRVRGFIEKGDLDCDGFKDFYISTEDATAFFSEESGALIELSIKEKQINVLDVLTRRPEACHSKISEATHHESNETRTIHERLLLKEKGLMEYLIYDGYRRASLLDHFLAFDVKLDDLAGSRYDEKGDFVGSPYYMEQLEKNGNIGVLFSREGISAANSVMIQKSVLFRKKAVIFDYLLRGKYNEIFAIEFNLSFLGSPFPEIHAGSKTLFIKDKGIHNEINKFSIRDKFLKMELFFSFDKDIDLWHYPIETISLSEQGVEKIYQGTSFLFIMKPDFKKIRFSLTFKEIKK